MTSNNSGVSSGWTEILVSENNPNISSEPSSSNSEPSINQPGRNQPAANPNPLEENTRPVERFPYQPDEVIGGDSVNSIQQRFLSKKESPSKEDIDWARMKAEDHFEMKVDIIRRMAALHPEGDWLRRGARALDNNRTATGEHSLDQLGDFLQDLSENREHSITFQQLKDKVFLRVEDIDENSGIH